MAYSFGGSPAALDTPPQKKGGVTYVPWRDVVEALQGSVSWDNATKTATGRVHHFTCRFTLGSGTGDVNGTTVTFSAPSYVDDGTLFVPADFFNSAYGYKVTVSGNDVDISLP
ncbi:MAG: copper amine oxidase N-terminal domain-containing protein [Armatimonadetes bacterium]|nr:copper amine oxidase N-terminal domain-containing protein [Armatimonadota bacterium]